MVETLKERIARALAPKLFRDLKRAEIELFRRETQLDASINLRVAEFLTRMDPFEPIMSKYRGNFGTSMERPEEMLGEQEAFQMKAMGYQVHHDRSFQHLIQWMLDTEGNNMVRKGNPTPETILFSRAMIAAPMLIRKEVRRLAMLYTELVDKGKGGAFDSDVSVE